VSPEVRGLFTGAQFIAVRPTGWVNPGPTARGKPYQHPAPDDRAAGLGRARLGPSPYGFVWGDATHVTTISYQWRPSDHAARLTGAGTQVSYLPFSN